MSYALYFMGGPLDLTKEMKEGNRPAHDRLYVPEMAPVPSSYTDYTRIAPQHTVHEYVLFPVPHEPYTGMRTFVAIWRGIET